MRALACWTAALVVIGAACGSDDGGGDGSGGSSGTGGAAGTGGNGGTSGTGTGGAAGSGASGGTSAGGTGGSSAGTGGSSAGTGGTGGSGAACNDTGTEPNNAEGQPVKLGDITDCDDTGATVSGVLNGSADQDWFGFTGSDVFSCAVDPTATITNGNLGARVCIFADCGINATTVTCVSGTPASAPSGLDGCCSNTSGRAAANVDCANASNDNAAVLIRADQQSTNACIVYDLAYHY